MEPFIPEEVALLILRHLVATDCPETAACLMKEVPQMNGVHWPRRYDSPAVLGTLLDILNDFGRAKLIVKSLVTCLLEEWKVIPEDTLSPSDSLTTQLRQISRLLTTTYGQSNVKISVGANNSKARNSGSNAVKSTKRILPFEPQSSPPSLESSSSSPSVSVIKTKRAVGSCTTEDNVLAWPPRCACTADKAETGTQTDRFEYADKIDTGTQTHIETVNTFEAETGVQTDFEVVGTGGVEESYAFTFAPVENVHASVTPPQAEPAPSSEVGPEQIKEQTLQVYNELLENAEMQEKLASIANRLSGMAMPTAEEWISETATDVQTDEPADADKERDPIDIFLRDLFNNEDNDGEVEAELEEGELIEPGSVKEFQDAEKRVIAQIKKDEGPMAVDIKENEPASYIVSIATSSTGAEERKSVIPATTEQKLITTKTIDKQKSKLPQKDKDMKVLAAEEVPPATKWITDSNNEEAYLRKTIWQRLGRRTITPKIPPTESSNANSRKLSSSERTPRPHQKEPAVEVKHDVVTGNGKISTSYQEKNHKSKREEVTDYRKSRKKSAPVQKPEATPSRSPKRRKMSEPVKKPTVSDAAEFMVPPATPRYGTIDSEWDNSQSLPAAAIPNNIESRTTLLLTPLKGLGLPVTPGKGFDQWSSPAANIHQLVLPTLPRVTPTPAQQRVVRAMSFTDTKNKSPRRGSGYGTDRKSVANGESTDRRKSESSKIVSNTHNAKTHAKNANSVETKAASSKSGPYVQFLVGGRQKKLTLLEQQSVYSLCQLKEGMSPGQVNFTPAHSPELLDEPLPAKKNLSTINLDKLLSIVHGEHEQGSKYRGKK